jgi:hypothetical protein
MCKSHIEHLCTNPVKFYLRPKLIREIDSSIITTNIAINTWGSPLFSLGHMPDWAVDLAAAAKTNCTVF